MEPIDGIKSDIRELARLLSQLWEHDANMLLVVPDGLRRIAGCVGEPGQKDWLPKVGDWVITNAGIQGSLDFRSVVDFYDPNGQWATVRHDCDGIPRRCYLSHMRPCPSEPDALHAGEMLAARGNFTDAELKDVICKIKWAVGCSRFDEASKQCGTVDRRFDICTCDVLPGDGHLQSCPLYKVLKT